MINLSATRRSLAHRFTRPVVQLLAKTPIAPDAITWLGFLQPFFIAAGIGAGLYCVWTLAQLLRMRRRKQSTAESQEEE